MNIYTESASAELFPLLDSLSPDKVFVFGNSHTHSWCIPNLDLPELVEAMTIAPGEGAKNLVSARTLWQQLAGGGATRRSVMLNVGGGTITDIGGFVAATYQRGIRFVNIPTTLLAMVDASIGGKTGINLGELKNYIGVFAPASATIISPEFLKTLPDQELVNGFAEMIKHGALAGGELWECCQSVFPAKTETTAWLPLIQKNAEYKLSLTSADMQETGLRARLNFGHTAGHALEGLYLSRGVEIPHGKAVAAGMRIETLAASHMGLTRQEFPEQLDWVIKRHFEPVVFQPDEIGQLMNFALKDKKHTGKGVACSLVAEPGSPLDVVEVPPETMNLAFSQYLHETGQTD
ncbi:MAG: 3-dehydroquinate synthase [Bacteroidetes bacterium]|nr:3-dehydroquinate synthase [Bacteroidota bacterium]